MKKAVLMIGLVVAGLSGGCLEKEATTPGTASTILYRHHFLGTEALARSTNAAKIPTILALPATRAFTDQVLQKLAKNPEVLWHKFLPAGASTPPALARPLLDDLASAESYAEVRGPLKHGESVFAIELNDDRAALWRTNLANILAGWKLGTPGSATFGDAKGWEIKKPESSFVIQFLRAGKWVLVGVGPEKLTLLPGLIDAIQKTGRPVARQADVLLEFEADCPRLGEWLPVLMTAKLPPIQARLLGKGDYLRSEARLLFSEPLPWKPEPWRIPTNFVRDPIISFTAARGIAPLLSEVKSVAELGLNPVPNQVAIWSPAMTFADTFFSMPMANPSNFLYEIGPKLPDFTKKLLGQSFGDFVLISNRNELVWGGWPVVVPKIRPLRDAGIDYLVGGILPVPIMTNRPPPALFDQLKDRPNLAYYDWEITQEQLKQARQLQQLWDMINHRLLAPTNAFDQKWLIDIAPSLGNTITEATLTSPKELTIVRKSDFGLTGWEVVTLARWVASPGFPWTFQPPAATPSAPGGLAPVPTNKPPDPKQKKGQ